MDRDLKTICSAGVEAFAMRLTNNAACKNAVLTIQHVYVPT